MSQMQQHSVFPWQIHRDSRGWPKWWQRWYEAWLVVTGRYTFWHAFHDGRHCGARDEYQRIIINGGDLIMVIDSAIYALKESEPTLIEMAGYRRAVWQRYMRDRPEIMNHMAQITLTKSALPNIPLGT